jgi:hypothetical protein
MKLWRCALLHIAQGEAPHPFLAGIYPYCSVYPTLERSKPIVQQHPACQFPGDPSEAMVKREGVNRAWPAGRNGRLLLLQVWYSEKAVALQRVIHFCPIACLTCRESKSLAVLEMSTLPCIHMRMSTLLVQHALASRCPGNRSSLVVVRGSLLLDTPSSTAWSTEPLISAHALSISIHALRDPPPCSTPSGAFRDLHTCSCHAPYTSNHSISRCSGCLPTSAFLDQVDR